MNRTTINTEIDVKITKDDIYQLLLGEREQELEQEISKIKFRRDNCQTKMNDTLNKIKDKIKDKFNLGEEVQLAPLYFNRYTNKSVSKTYSFHTIEELLQLRNPHLSKRNYHKTVCNATLQETVTVIKEVTIDGFTGNLSKEIDLTGIKVTTFLKTYNENAFKKFEYNKEINDLEYQKICLPYDKKIKAAFLKKIIKKKDIALLLK